MQKFYEKDDITLFQCDCIGILNKATPESVDMIFADPPYMPSNGGITCQSGKVVSVNKGEWDKSCGLDDDFNFHQRWINACNLIVIPKHYFTKEIIIKRKPLSPNAHRAGWVGCNIDISSIPESGKLYLVKNGQEENYNKVIDKFNKMLFLRKSKPILWNSIIFRYCRRACRLYFTHS